MSEQVLIKFAPQETRVAILQDNILQDLYVEKADQLSLIGNIYKARVVRILPGLQAAFVDIGLARTALLAETNLRLGQDLFVQVVKDPIGNKGAKVIKKIASKEHVEPTLIYKILRDQVTANTDLIMIDNLNKLSEIKRNQTNFIREIQLYLGQDIFSLFGVNKQIYQALQPRVALKSGGYLIIEQHEAMATIDVNTGAFVGQKNLEDTAYATNQESIPVLTRQLRLRNISGIIIVDFIDMQNPLHRESIISLLTRELAHDKATTKVSELSSLGLVQITRKRTRISLRDSLCKVCVNCDGIGYVNHAS